MTSTTPEPPDSWQPETIRQLTALAQADHAVRELVLIGSYAHARLDAHPDAWSDVDAVIVVDDGAVERFCPATSWLAPLGEIYASSPSCNGLVASTRVCFTDGRRVDLVVIAESALERIDEWGPGLFSSGARILFSRSAHLDNALERTFDPPEFEPAPQGEIQRLSNDFWFKGVLAVTKVARRDLLVALHLSLDMVRDCCVLAMMLRDRRLRTHHHRDGRAGDPFVAQLQTTQKPYTAAGILDRAQESSIAFDELAAQYASDYRPRRGPLLAWIDRVRTSLTDHRT